MPSIAAGLQRKKNDCWFTVQLQFFVSRELSPLTFVPVVLLQPRVLISGGKEGEEQARRDQGRNSLVCLVCVISG